MFEVKHSFPNISGFWVKITKTLNTEMQIRYIICGFFFVKKSSAFKRLMPDGLKYLLLKKRKT